MASCTYNTSCKKGQCCNLSSYGNYCSPFGQSCYTGDGSLEVYQFCSRDSQCATNCCLKTLRICKGTSNTSLCMGSSSSSSSSSQINVEELPLWAICAIAGGVLIILLIILCCICKARRRKKRAHLRREAEGRNRASNGILPPAQPHKYLNLQPAYPEVAAALQKTYGRGNNTGQLPIIVLQLEPGQLAGALQEKPLSRPLGPAHSLHQEQQKGDELDLPELIVECVEAIEEGGQVEGGEEQGMEDGEEEGEEEGEGNEDAQD